MLFNSSLGRTHSATAALEEFCAQTKCHFSLVFNVGGSIGPRPLPRLRIIDRRNVDQLQKIDLVVDEHVDGLARAREVGDTPERLESAFFSEAGHRNIPIGDVMAMTEHPKVDTILAYYRSVELGANVVSNLLDRGKIPVRSDAIGWLE